MQNIKIKNSLDLCEIDIEGAIGVAEEWQFENAGQRVATYEKFRECIAQIEAVEAQRVVVNIRSTGGDVNDAMLIYEALVSLGIPITTRCYGYVASAATVIAQAASTGERLISAGALYLVHNSTCMAEGNASDLSSKAELLLKTDQSLAELYARRSSRTAEEFAELMAQEGGNGRWLTAEEAIEAGLADAVIELAVSETPAEGEDQNDGAVKNFWRKLGAKLGLGDTSSQQELERRLDLPLNDHNILHSTPLEQQQEQQRQQSVMVMEQQQGAAQPTMLPKVEDPTLHEVPPAKNQAAYASDVQAFKR